MPDALSLEIDLAPGSKRGLILPNPVMVASGTFGYGTEFKAFDVQRLGAVVTKTTTLQPRRGNVPQRIAETPSGMLNSIGLPNGGIDYFIENQLPILRRFETVRVVNIAGDTVAQFIEVARRLDRAGGMDALELNISCPNVEGGRIPFAYDPQVTRELVRGIR